MQYVPRSQLIIVKADLRRADAALTHARGVFISSGAARDAAAINALIDRIAHLIARIDRALTAKP